METNFELNTYVRSDGRQQIMLRFTNYGDRVRFGTGCKILATRWDNKRKQVKKLPNDEHHKINQILKDLEAEIRDIVYYIISQKKEQAYASSVKAMYQARRRVERGLDFWGYYDRYIEESKPTWKPATYRGAINAYDLLKRFEKDESYILAFPRMGRSFYTRFRNYCLDKGFAQSSTINYSVKIKSFFIYAESSRWIESNPAKSWQLDTMPRASKGPIDRELFKRIRDFKGDRRLANAAKRFTFHCYTGMRFTDAKTGNYELIRDDIPYIRFLNNKKTKAKSGDVYSEIPLIPEALEILDTGLPQYELSHYNKLLKELAKVLDTDAYLSSHTARKTMASYLEEVGASDRIIKKALTHSGGLTDRYAKSNLSTLYNLLREAFEA